jgi:carbohydrate-binding DOMON domain-containing protein
MTCKVSIYWPDNDDFNAMLMNGDQVRELVFYKKQQEVIMKLEASLKHFSPQGMHISDDVKELLRTALQEQM